MPTTLPAETLDTIAARNGVSSATAAAMLNALQMGGGTMAQFNIPELGGNGQWMRGGMTMVGDMFNNALKARVDGLCNDLTPLLTANPGFAAAGNYQTATTQMQWQSGTGQAAPTASAQPMAPMASAMPQPMPTPMQPMTVPTQMEQNPAMTQMQPMAMQPMAPMQPMTMQPMAPMTFTPMATSGWWPSDLGTPSSVGAQNGMQYAVFPASRRLAININGAINLYDTGAHLISGVQQQQGTGLSSVAFTSQLGTFGLSTLHRV